MQPLVMSPSRGCLGKYARFSPVNLYTWSGSACWVCWISVT